MITFKQKIIIKHLQTQGYLTSLKWSGTWVNLASLWFIMNLRFMSRHPFSALPSSQLFAHISFRSKRLLGEVIIAFLNDFMLWDTVTPNCDQLIPRALFSGRKMKQKTTTTKRKCDQLQRKHKSPHFLSFVHIKGKKTSKEKKKTLVPSVNSLAKLSSCQQAQISACWLRGNSCCSPQSGASSANCIRAAWTSVSKHRFRINPQAVCVSVCPWTCGWFRRGVMMITALRASDKIQINAGTKCSGKHSMFCNHFAGMARSTLHSLSQS